MVRRVPKKQQPTRARRDATTAIPGALILITDRAEYVQAGSVLGALVLSLDYRINTAASWPPAQ